METSQAGVDLVKSFEGFSTTPYKCPAGVLTIGYGHTGDDVILGIRIDPQQAEILLRKDLKEAEKAVEEKVKIPLNQVQFDALVSFTFNVGSGALSVSTLLRRLNAGEDPITVVKEELPRWNKGDGGKTLEGLTRRRLSEIELFCQAPPQPKSGTIAITALRNTWLKKQPRHSADVPRDELAQVYQGRTIKNCRILDHKDKHTYLELGFGLGKWWVFDEHWDGLLTETGVKPYAIKGTLRYLRNFPYFWQQNNGPEGWRQCQTSAIAMCLRYLDVPGITDDKDYLKYVNKHGDTTLRETHTAALAEIGAYARYTVSADEYMVKAEIDKGRPVVAGILHHGRAASPGGGGHYVVITGYDDTVGYWLVQDPFGELDLVNGVWEDTGSVAGKNIHYSYKNLNPRFFVGGGANGWCWLNFKRK